MKQAKLKRSHLGLVIIVGTLTVILFIMIVGVALLLLSNQAALPAFGSTPPIEANPQQAVDLDGIDPALAIASLGGVEEQDVIQEAIGKDRTETALAALLYEPTVADRETAGNLLLLASLYSSDGENEKAILTYRLAGKVAVLSPEIQDTVRADIFIQAAEGLIALEEIVWAKFYLDQAFTLATESPFLQAVHRRELLGRLNQNYLDIDERELARQSINLSASPGPQILSTGQESVLPRAEPVPLPPAIQEAESERWIRAQELTLIMVERAGRAPEAAVTALREALLAEDVQKLPFYDSEFAAEAQISRRIDITTAKLEWLSLKYRVARGAYGMSLVPEWEAQTDEIRAALNETYAQLFSLYAELIVVLPEASEINRASVELLRREVIAGELGRFPGYNAEAQRDALIAATDRLIVDQPELTIFVGRSTVNEQEIYSLISVRPGE